MSLLHYWETQRSVKRRKTSGETTVSENTVKQESEAETPEDSASDIWLASHDVETSGHQKHGHQKGEENDHDDDHEHNLKSSQTDLETSLPTIETEEQAIREYEASQEKDEVDQEPRLHARLRDGSWQKGRSSIYVDAFNLALETVLEEESHLFDEAELHIFNEWKGLAYESQYLYEYTHKVSLSINIHGWLLIN